MLPIITEISFLEKLAERFNISAPRFLTMPASYEKVKSALEEWGGEAIVKPDIIAGKRGKAGAVVKVDNIQDAIKEIKRLSTLEINGKIARTAYLVENIPAQYEIYSAITYNTSYLSPSLTISMEGGIDIESVSDEKKMTIPVDIYRGLDAYQASEVFSKLGCPKKLISILSRSMVSFWDLFISAGMLS